MDNDLQLDRIDENIVFLIRVIIGIVLGVIVFFILTYLKDRETTEKS